MLIDSIEVVFEKKGNSFIFWNVFLLLLCLFLLIKISILRIQEKITCNSSNASFNEFRVRLPCVSSRSLNDIPFDNAFSQSISPSKRSLNRVTGYNK